MGDDGPVTANQPAWPAAASACVTGGAGFVGGRLARALLDAGAHVTIIDDLSSADAEGPAALVETFGERATFLYASILDRRALADAIAGCDAVFHCAAFARPTRSTHDPARCAEVNMLGTVRVVEAARAAGVRRIVHASTAAVYGPADRRNAAAQPTPRCETDAPDPATPYAATKLAAEHVLRAWARTLDIDAVNLRFSEIIGAGQPMGAADGAAVTAICRAIAGGGPATLRTPLDAPRDMIPIEHAVAAMLRAGMHREPLGGASLNVGAGGGPSPRELAQRIASGCGVTEPELRESPARPGDDDMPAVNPDRARTLLGLAAPADLAHALQAVARDLGACDHGGVLGAGNAP